MTKLKNWINNRIRDREDVKFILIILVVGMLIGSLYGGGLVYKSLTKEWYSDEFSQEYCLWYTTKGSDVSYGYPTDLNLSAGDIYGFT